MSPRNTSTCPQCRERQKARHEAEKQSLANAFKQVSQTEYERLRKEIPPEKPESETLEEYFEWEFTSRERFWFRFHFVCDVCGFDFSVHDEVDCPLNVTIEDDELN